MTATSTPASHAVASSVGVAVRPAFLRHLLTSALILLLVLQAQVGWGQFTIFSVAGGGTLPSGWVGTNNVVAQAIDRTTYYLVDAGNPSDLITTGDYNLAGLTSATLNVQVATFGNSPNNPLKIEVSLNGGSSWVASYVSATPTSTTYIAGGPITISQTFTATTRFRFSNNGTSGTGVRIQSLALSATPASPTITSISPASTTAGGSAFTLTVNGSNFINVDATNRTFIRWNGSSRTTTWVSSSQLTASIPASDITTAGSATVTTLSTGNAVASGGLIFTINPSSTPDCQGVVGGSALPGTSCNDNNACTVNDLYQANCSCVGTIQDTDGDGVCDANDGCPNDINKTAAGSCGCGNPEPNASCNDGSACTINDVVGANCVCAGTIQDTDGDGVCDASDNCPLVSGQVGSTCNDNNSCTVNDVLNASCICVGSSPTALWTFGASLPGSTSPSSNSLASVTVGALSVANNNGTSTLLATTVASSTTDYPTASAGVNAGAAPVNGALSTTASTCFQFTVSPSAGFTFTLNGISFGTRSTGTGPQAYSVRSSLDNYGTEIAGGTIVTTSTWVFKAHSGLSVSTVSGQPITFRIYGYNGSGAATNTVVWRIDDITIGGCTIADADGDGIVDSSDGCQATSAVTGSPLFRGATCDASPGSFITYSSINSLSVATAISTCTAGSTCAGGTAQPVACAGGTYCPAGSITAITCPAGSYCPASSSAATTCPGGSYCPTGSALDVHCPAGTYCPSGSSATTPCPAGSYCPAQSSSSTLCSAGHFSSSGAAVCSDCQPGYYQDADGAQSCIPAPAGSFVATTAAITATPCSAGKFSNALASTSCTDCAAGTYSSSTGSTSCATCNGIPNAPTGATSCTPTFTFTVVRAGTGGGTITSTPAGISCGSTCSSAFAQGTQVELSASADPGSHFTGWSGGGCTGTGTCSVSVSIATTVSASFATCAAGSYCPGGSAQPAPCAAGSSSSAGAAFCLSCSAGQFSPAGSATCSPCAAGSASAFSGSATCTPCSAGTYQDLQGQTSCVDAPAGHYVPGTGAISAIACAAGTYSSVSGATQCQSCSSSAGTTTGAVDCLSYTGSPYCGGSGVAIPSLSSGSGGALYVCSSGQCSSLVMDPQTGVIDLSLSAPGTYRVCYSTNSCTDVVIRETVSLSSVSVSQTGGTNPSCDAASVEFTVQGSYSDGSSLSAAEATAVWSPGLITVNGLSFSMAAPSTSSVSCAVTSSRACLSSSAPVSSSNSIALVVRPTVSITPSSLSISQTQGSSSTCDGSSVAFSLSGMYSDGSSASSDLSATWSRDVLTITGQSFSFSATTGTAPVHAASVTSSRACVSNSGSVASPPDFALSVSPSVSIVPSSVSVSQVGGSNPSCSSATDVAFRVNGMFSDGTPFSSRPPSEFTSIWGGGLITVQGRDFAMTTPAAGTIAAIVVSARQCLSGPAAVPSSASASLSVTPSVSLSSVSFSQTTGTNPSCAGSPVEFTAEVHYSDGSSSALRPPSETTFEFFKGGSSMGSASTNPLYQDNGLSGTNPLYASASSSRACLTGPSSLSSTPVSLVVSSSPNAGTAPSAPVSVCSNSQPVSLFSYLSGGAQSGGVWRYSDPYNPLPPVITSGSYDPAQSPAGDYTYTVSAPGCSDASSTLHMETMFAQTWYPDVDGDGFGDMSSSGTFTCTQPQGSVLDHTDCNDGCFSCHPGATELCSGNVDEDCDGSVDDLDYLFFVDADGDGHGDGVVLTSTTVTGTCTTPPPTPSGFSSTGDDCDDTDAARFPGNPEVCDGKDNDCDGVLPATEVDDDNDTFVECSFAGATWPAGSLVVGGGDCDDTDATVNPGRTEQCDGRDDDCDGLVDEGFPNTDGDALSNCVDPDDDNDGLSDALESVHGTDPLDMDSDDDGLGDGIEVLAHGTDPLDQDSDDDTISDLQECGSGTAAPDTDGDGVIDALDQDSDGDSVSDAMEAGDTSLATPVGDLDGDGFADWRDQDDDGDSVPTLDESGDSSLATPPVDTDSDGVADYRDTDSDNDTFADGTDSCRLTPGQIGSTCDDGNAATTGDVLSSGCVCSGTLSNACTDPLATNYVAGATPANNLCSYCPATVATDATMSTPVVIGAGIPGSHMSVGTNCNGIEVSLSAFSRFGGSIVPSGSVYTTYIGNSPTSGTNPAPAAGMARWNYLMSVSLGQYDFTQVHVYLDMDRDPAATTSSYSTVDVSAYMASQGLQGTHLAQSSENFGFAYWTQPPFSFPAFDPNVPGTYELRVRVESSLTGASLMTVPIQVVVLPRVQLAARVMLDGPYVDPTPLSANADGLMRDDLRAQGLLPLQQPYCTSPLSSGASSYCGSESTTASVLSVTGPDAIVDWVLVELRPAGTAGAPVRQACLLQRDGDVVSADGTSPVSFVGTMPGDFSVVVLHRNHLGVMSSTPLSFSASTPRALDFSLASTPVHGTGALKPRDGRVLMFGGNARVDDRLRYTGTNNDRDPMLIAVGGFTPTATLLSVYRVEDCNLDGMVRYTGFANDRDMLLENINVGFTTISVTRQLLQQVP